MIISNSMYAHMVGHSVLLAEGRYVEMGRRFRRGGSNTDTMEVLLLLCTLAAVVAAVWLLTRYASYRERRRGNCQQALLAELCSAHALDWSNRQLLNTLARVYRLPTVAQLFLEPKWFDPTNLDRRLASRVDEITALRDHLFHRPAAAETKQEHASHP